jgi:hypothetical protein
VLYDDNKVGLPERSKKMPMTEARIKQFLVVRVWEERMNSAKPKVECVDSEWWGWPLLDLLADVPEMLIQYLIIKLLRRVRAFRQAYARRPIVDERERNQHRE